MAQRVGWCWLSTAAALLAIQGGSGCEGKVTGGDRSYWTIDVATNSITVEGLACNAIIHGVT